MDVILGMLIDGLAHRIGVCILQLMSGGRFKGDTGHAWGWALVVGSSVMLVPFVGFIGWHNLHVCSLVQLAVRRPISGKGHTRCESESLTDCLYSAHRVKCCFLGSHIP